MFQIVQSHHIFIFFSFDIYHPWFCPYFLFTLLFVKFCLLVTLFDYLFNSYISHFNVIEVLSEPLLGPGPGPTPSTIPLSTPPFHSSSSPFPGCKITDSLPLLQARVVCRVGYMHLVSRRGLLVRVLVVSIGQHRTPQGRMGQDRTVQYIAVRH